jgi:hypothetical protein
MHDYMPGRAGSYGYFAYEVEPSHFIRRVWVREDIFPGEYSDLFPSAVLDLQFLDVRNFEPAGPSCIC